MVTNQRPRQFSLGRTIKRFVMIKTIVLCASLFVPALALAEDVAPAAPSSTETAQPAAAKTETGKTPKAPRVKKPRKTLGPGGLEAEQRQQSRPGADDGFGQRREVS